MDAQPAPGVVNAVAECAAAMAAPPTSSVWHSVYNAYYYIMAIYHGDDTL